MSTRDPGRRRQPALEENMVGARGFEPPTPCPPDKCANRAALRSDGSAYSVGLRQMQCALHMAVDAIPPQTPCPDPGRRVRCAVNCRLRLSLRRNGDPGIVGSGRGSSGGDDHVDRQLSQPGATRRSRHRRQGRLRSVEAFFRELAPDWHSQWAWDHYEPTILGAGAPVRPAPGLRDRRRARSAVHAPRQAARHGIDLIVNDIDAGELALTPAGLAHRAFRHCRRSVRARRRARRL